MKSHADKHRSERQFQVGDLVLLKLHPSAIRAVIIGTRANQKLAFKYFDPFSVLQHVGKVA
jgi:hypothetical protein